MILKMNNKEKKFYTYMGKYFGSRLVEKQTNDRIYDDPGKEWYLSVDGENVKAFVSLQKDTVKNVYAVKEEDLKEVFVEVQKDRKIKHSIVPKVYEEIYKQSGLQVSGQENYKNFVVIANEVK